MKTPTQVFSSEIFENFKSTYFEEHLGTTASEKNKSIACILGKVVNGKRQNWATNAFYWKYKPHKVSLCNIRINFILME